MFEFNRKKKKYTVVTSQNLSVVIEPISMTEQNEILKGNTVGKTSTTLTKGSEDQTIQLAETDHLEQNIQVAQASWKSWDCEENKKPVPCNNETIRYLFDYYYDTANEVVTKLDEMIKAENQQLCKEKKT
jgi:hypothetical protein